MKVLILGHAQHGKDTFAEMLGLSFISSSVAALDLFLFDRLNKVLVQRGFKPYKNKEEAFADRHNWRELWHQEICLYNLYDKAKLAKGIMKNNDCYVGMRSNEEYKACLNIDLFDAVIWVHAGKRKPLESSKSFNITYDPNTMILIHNNSSEFMLRCKALYVRFVLYFASIFIFKPRGIPNDP